MNYQPFFGMNILISDDLLAYFQDPLSIVVIVITFIILFFQLLGLFSDLRKHSRQ